MAASPKAQVKTRDFDDAPARDATLFLIDGSSLAYRSFFALPPEIATSDGRPTNALLGFANMLLKLVTDYRPDTVIVAWDVGGETVRKRAFAEYKAHRPEMPDGLSAQWPHFKPLVEAFGFTNISHAEYEADDVIGTLAAQASARGLKTCIVTYDRDSMQLVSDRVVVMMTTKGVSEVSVFTPERVAMRYGVRPDQIADFIALRGDSSDNIPGVPGIGDKTAATLLGEFSSLAHLLESTDRVSGEKRRQNLVEFADQARVSRELATIVCDLPLDIDLDAVHAAPPDSSQLAQIFQTFEFRTLARRVAEMDLTGTGARERGAPSTAGDPTGAGTPTDTSAAATDIGLASARIVSAHELRGIVEARGADVAAEPLQLVVAGAAADDEAVTAACVIREPVPDGGEPGVWVAVVQGSPGPLADALHGMRLQTFDFKSLPAALVRRGAANGARATTLVDDVLISAYLLDPARRTFLLGELLADESLATRIAMAGDDRTLRDVAAHAALLGQLASAHRARLADLGMLDLYQDIELPLVDVLLDMEHAGVGVDTYRLGEISAKVADQLDELHDRACTLAGGEFNLGSPQQLSSVLFEKLGLPTQRKGKTGYSTDHRVLRDLRDMHPIVPVIEQWRELSKLKNTYLDALPRLVSPTTGRIHTTFSQVSTATGRLSSVNPNLQNIPVRTAVGREIRSAFIPADGNVFISCDYSQVELRLLAHVSREPKLSEIFERGDDVHLMTAAEVAGIDPAEVTREQRNAAKAINFGIIYGISGYGLAAQLQISREQAQQYIDRYLGRYPHVGDFIAQTISKTAEQGYVTTLFGRRRPVPELTSPVYAKRQLGERLAVNTVLQGTAADIMKIAMVRVHARLRREGLASQIVLQIHDELLLEGPKEEARAVTALVREEMVGAFDCTPPLEVESGSGSTWLDAK